MFASNRFECRSAEELTRRLDGRWNGRSGLVRCPDPLHEDNDPSCSVSIGRNGRVLIYCPVCGGDRAYRAARDQGLFRSVNDRSSRRGGYVARQSGASEIRAAYTGAHEDNEQNRFRVEQIFQPTIHYSESPLARSYLDHRHLPFPDCDDLRFNPRTKHGPTNTFLPAIIAAVRDLDGKLGAVHRTYLAPDGRSKANARPARMMFGPLGQGAVRLAEHGPTLMIGEGWETCLAAMEIFGLPAWAALSASRLSKVAVPPEVEEIIFLADNDAAGIKHAEAAVLHWRQLGKRARMLMPAQPGWDFNDVLIARTR